MLRMHFISLLKGCNEYKAHFQIRFRSNCTTDFFLCYISPPKPLNVLLYSLLNFGPHASFPKMFNKDFFLKFVDLDYKVLLKIH